MNPYYKDMPCPGGCGQNITRNKETDTWTHAGLHDAACPFKQYEPMDHKYVLKFRWNQIRFNSGGDLEKVPVEPSPPPPEPKLADVISLAQYRKKKS